jgi:glutathione synthase
VTRAIGVVMDPIASIATYKDSTFAMMLEIQARDWELWYLELGDLFLAGDRAWGRQRRLRVKDDRHHWFEFGEERTLPLDRLDAILMRKDPPFDIEYVYSTHLLEQAERRGVLVVNRPATLRDANEKLFATWFPQCAPPTLVSRDGERIRAFIAEQGAIVLKPLGGMGGASVFRIDPGDPNTNVIIETLTEHGARYAMAQRFLPEISAGDKRILLVDGQPVPYALARIPKPGESRGNLAAGGRGQGMALSERDRWIAAQVGPVLRERGVLFAGLDVIGDYLTEINITSPTCIRELDAQFGLNIASELMDCIAERFRP